MNLPTGSALAAFGITPELIAEATPAELRELEALLLAELAELGEEPEGPDPTVAGHVELTQLARTPGELARIITGGRELQRPHLDKIDQVLVRAAEEGGQRIIVNIGPRYGKALALDTPIATPSGWTSMGELVVGDQVFDERGRPCTVTWLSPIWTDRPCFEVTTTDGERVIADAEHEWAVRPRPSRATRIVTTTWLANGRVKAAQIGTCPGLDLPDTVLPLDPYLLGAWLGDGHSRSAAITSADPWIIDQIRDRTGLPCERWTRSQGRASTYSLVTDPGSSKRSPVRSALEQLGVWDNKHIPIGYLRASRAQRLALLQGLVDTDGYVSPVSGQVEYCSTSERLARGVAELVWSLGAKATLAEGRATLDGRDIGPKYRVMFMLADAASLPRKAPYCRDSRVGDTRYVTAAPVESVPVRCIEVDSPSHLYLVGRSLLPTHNSRRAARWGSAWRLHQRPDDRIIMATHTAGLAEGHSRWVRDLLETHDLGIKPRQDTRSVGEWYLDGYEGGILAAGIGGTITGFGANLLVIDDAVKNAEQAASKTWQDKTWIWYTETAFDRLEPNASVVILMTRWNPNDLTGKLLQEQPDVWTVIRIPTIAEDDDPLGRAPGELLWKERYDAAAVAEQRRTLGSVAFAARHQQKPEAAKGTVWRRGWWRRHLGREWGRDPVTGVRRVAATSLVIQSWDLAFKDLDDSDFVVGQVWEFDGANAYLLDQIRDRMDIGASMDAIRGLKTRWPQTSAILIEDKANGPAVMSLLRGKLPGLIPVTPSDSKIGRARAVAPFIEAGNVYIPDPDLEGCEWVEDFLDEASSFGTGARNDDQVDTASQALRRLFLPDVDGTGQTQQHRTERWSRVRPLG